MEGIRFHHLDPNSPLPDLILRLNPTRVEWEYNLNTQVTPTYGGQVIQILSINYTQLVLEGRFGREGPHGIVKRDGNDLINRFLTNKEGEWVPRTGASALHDYSTTGPLGIGISQMTTWFQDYFAIASQGYSKRTSGHYDQWPIEITYGGGFDDIALDSTGLTERTWHAYPIDFPSYSRALEEFAPEWQVFFKVEQPDYTINTTTLDNAIQDLNNIKSGVGYTAFNPFSDPMASLLPTEAARRAFAIKSIKDKQPLIKQYNSIIDLSFDHFNQFLSGISDADLANLVFNGASVPQVFADAAQTIKTQQTQNQNKGIRTDPTKPPQQSHGGFGAQ